MVLEPGYPLVVAFLSENLHFHRDSLPPFITSTMLEAHHLMRRNCCFAPPCCMHALRYMQFANQQKRWERVCYAVAQREQLLSVLP